MATVILVAIGMVIAIGASIYLMGTADQYAAYETVELPAAYCTKNPSVNNSRWGISISIKNGGPKPTLIDYVMVNDVLVDEYDIIFNGSLADTTSIGTSLTKNGLYLESGESSTVYVWIGSDLLSSGTSVSIHLHSISGINYIKLVKLS